MKRAWAATKLVAIATLVGILATAPVRAFEVRPDKNLTGGSVRTGDRLAACGHAKENRRPLPPAWRDEILRRYGLPPGTHPDYEIDHLIPLCLGGSDDLSNLWAQPRRSIGKEWNAEAKDRLERRMCDLVCAGQIDIAAAQTALATDWIDAYQKYYEGRSKPAVPSNVPPNQPVGNEFSTEAQAKARCPSDTVVWVNLKSKIYHFSGTKDYGNTKHGAYMCERDTSEAGMRAAKNETHPRTNQVQVSSISLIPRGFVVRDLTNLRKIGASRRAARQ